MLQHCSELLCPHSHESRAGCRAVAITIRNTSKFIGREMVVEMVVEMVGYGYPSGSIPCMQQLSWCVESGCEACDACENTAIATVVLEYF
jgi:hypothetical protein